MLDLLWTYQIFSDFHVCSLTLKFLYYFQLRKCISEQESLASISGLNAFCDVDLGKCTKIIISIVSRILLVGEMIFLLLTYFKYPTHISLIYKEHPFNIILMMALRVTVILNLFCPTLENTRNHVIVLGVVYCSFPILQAQLYVLRWEEDASTYSFSTDNFGTHF